MAPLLSIEGLSVSLRRRGEAPARIVRDVSLAVAEGEIAGLIGESGSGKTLTAKALTGMLPQGIRVEGGRAMFRGRDLLALPERELRRVRGAEISVIPQDALHAMNPVLRVGRQVGEPVEIHAPRPRGALRALVTKLLGQVRIPDPAARIDDHPHQFSGGMQQRALTAAALAMQPPFIIADEPTTALDVTIQAEIIRLIRDLRDETGTGFLFISHDLGLVAGLCDRLHVMYAGEIVESGDAAEIFARPRHPYTRALLGSVPRLHARRERLETIPGQIPSPAEEIAGCRFRARCALAGPGCEAVQALRDLGGGHLARCRVA